MVLEEKNRDERLLSEIEAATGSNNQRTFRKTLGLASRGMMSLDHAT